MLPVHATDDLVSVETQPCSDLTALRVGSRYLTVQVMQQLDLIDKVVVHTRNELLEGLVREACSDDAEVAQVGAGSFDSQAH